MARNVAVGDCSAGEDLSIGQVSQRTRLSVHALRYYEREQLLVSPIRRDGAGRRAYSSDDVDWLLTCVNLRATGMPIDDVRGYVQLVRQGAETESERLDLLRAHRTRMRRQLTKLHACLKLVDHKLEGRCESPDPIEELRITPGTVGNSTGGW